MVYLVLFNNSPGCVKQARLWPQAFLWQEIFYFYTATRIAPEVAF